MSTSTENNLLNVLGEKLGLETPIIIKAQEYRRLCSIKPNLDRITDVPKAVLCLDLAAKNGGVAFDKTTALKFSTLTTALYQKYYNLIETTLKLTEVLTIPKLCVKLNCSEAKDLAETIISKYKAQNLVHDDLNHPQYNAVAVYTACKLKGIKVAKPQFRQESQLRVPQWKQLESRFFEFVKQCGLEVDQKQSSKKTKDSVEIKVAKIAESIENKSTSEDVDMHDEIEEYEVWKARILKEAMDALNNELQPTQLKSSVIDTIAT